MEPGYPEDIFVWNPIMRQYVVNVPHQTEFKQDDVTVCPFCVDIVEGKESPERQVCLHRQDIALHPPAGEAYDIIFHRDHHRAFSQLTLDEMYGVTLLWRDLYRDLASRYPVVMISVNEERFNRQVQYHPHGEAFGISIMPPLLEQELETVIRDELEGHGCPFCRISAELSESIYVVASNSTWQTFLPPFARYPYEVHFYPRRHIANLAEMHDNELRELAVLILKVLRGYNALLNGAMSPMPYLLGLHQLTNEHFHLHVEILALARAPNKLKLTASSESIWYLWVNDSSPAQNAQELRATIAKVAL